VGSAVALSGESPAPSALLRTVRFARALLGLDGRGRPSPHNHKQNQRRRTGVSAPHEQNLRFADGDRAVAGETPALPLDNQILHIQRVVFYEFSAGFYVFAH
jgi:hypothetical protein